MVYFSSFLLILLWMLSYLLSSIELSLAITISDSSLSVEQTCDKFFCKDIFWLVLVWIKNVRYWNLLCDSHFRSYMVNMKVKGISSHHTPINTSWYIKVTFSGFICGSLLHINLIRSFFKPLNNLWNILHDDISNGISCIFVFIWP